MAEDWNSPFLRGPWREIRRGLASLYNCLSWRLVFILSGTLLLLLGATGWLALHLHRGNLVANLEENAVDIAETILSATQYAMLENDRQNLERIIENIGSRDQVLDIRVIDPRGRIAYSSRASERGTVASVEAAACRGCHAGDQIRVPETLRDGLHLYDLPGGGNALGLAVPVLNAPACSEAACHVHPLDLRVLGVMELELSTARMEAVLAAERSRTILAGLVSILLICTVIGGLAWRVVHQPIHDLLEGTRALGAGELAHRIPGAHQGELGELADSFNAMADRLGRAQNELEAWGRTLEMRVEEKSRELERTRDHLVFTEKMVSLGKLAAVVAHEINNPLAGILVSVKLVRRRLNKLLTQGKIEDPQMAGELDQTLGMVERETARSGDIVRNLLLFSRQREISVSEEDFNEIVRRSLRLVQHKANLQEIETILELDETIPKVLCDASKIEQAILALIMNSIEAMPDGGALTLRTSRVQDRVRIEIRDTGVGIPPEIKGRIFEPFFSTKNETSGTGLGLSVMYGIIHRHQGTVDFESVPGEGTTFHVDLPFDPGPIAELESDLAGPAIALRSKSSEEDGV